jgi:hypothetical protein
VGETNKTHADFAISTMACLDLPVSNAALKSQQRDSIFDKNLLRENHAKSIFQTARFTSNAVRAFCFSKISGFCQTFIWILSES